MSETIRHKLYGSMTALITPFRANAFDVIAYQQLIERQIMAGTHAIISVGTTGESPVLDHTEHLQVIDVAVKTAAGRIPVIAGTGANSTQEAIYLTREATKLGADAALIVAPYYNKPGQEALYQHFLAIHEATDIAIILYNVPGRTASDILPETVARLAQLPRIVGLKDASGDIERFSEHRDLCPDDFLLFSGDDGAALGAAAHGAAGCISVSANVAPRLCADFQNALRAKDFAKALELQDMLYPLHKVLFCEANPVPTKYACSLLGICENTLRLPLIPLSAPLQEKVKQVLDGFEKKGMPL